MAIIRWAGDFETDGDRNDMFVMLLSLLEIYAYFYMTNIEQIWRYYNNPT